MKADLFFESPTLNAAGMLGFAPDARKPLNWARLGAFFTNPVSLGARSPASGERMAHTPGGVVLHTGWYNPGFNEVLRQYRPRWITAAIPIVVHLLAQTPQDLTWMVRRLEALDNLLALEIGIPPESTAAETRTLAHAAQGELPIILRLPFETASTLWQPALEGGAAAVSLAAPRALTLRENGLLLGGRLYGQAVFPLALHLTQSLAAAGAPVIAAGGVYTLAQEQAMLQAGALAVQWDTALWRGGW